MTVTRTHFIADSADPEGISQDERISAVDAGRENSSSG
jgi:hypothetical protein